MEFEEAMNRFRDFLETFPAMDNPVYIQEIRRCRASYLRSLNVDFEHLLDHDYELAQLIIDEPQFTLPACDAAFETLYRPDERIDLHVRFYNVVPARIEIRDLRSEHINTLVQVEGVVRRISEVKPEIVEAVFECERCGQIQIVEQEGQLFKKPTVCVNPACGRQGPFRLREDQSKFVDWQSIRVQERPERLRGGRMPRSVDCIIRDDIVDRAQAGNRVNVTGMLRTQQEATQRGLKTTFHIYLETNHVELREKEVEEVEISKEDEEEIKRLSREPFVCEKITSSIAPAIYGYQEVKEAIALQMFSGVFRVLADGTRLRGDSNILLVGDPGTAKSQILQYVARVAPRGIYTSGKGVSGVGLTAAVVRDEMTGSWALEAGALVLADGGMCCIDELDKMSTDDRSAIHEALEQQSYHPSTELLFANGRKTRIGAFVDGLMEKGKPLQGVNCEILPVQGYALLSAEGPIPVEQVSRHTAPDHFVQLTYSNGRSITVTPEHPVFTMGENGVETRPAAEVEEGSAVPGVTLYWLHGEGDLSPVKGRRFPTRVTGGVARLLGYITRTGHVYRTKKTRIAEIMILSSDASVVSDAKLILKEEFGEYSFVDKKMRNGKIFYRLRCPSPSLYRFFRLNFPEVVTLFSKKRIPHLIFQSGVKEFVRGFASSGGVIRSVGLAEDFQDLLLCLGYPSTMVKRENGYEVQANVVQAQVVEHSSGLVSVLGENRGTLDPLHVVKVEKVPNCGVEWVYDVTVKDHVFACAGLLLHNTISIAKAGVVATLNARTSVLAACNPKYGRFDRFKTVAEQIDLPSTLLSRFDLVYVIMDQPHEETDRRIAEHIVNIHRKPDEAVTPPIPLDLLEKYILFAKNTIKPKLTKEAAQKLMNFYVDMRKAGETEGSPVPITARQLDALIRLSEARSRTRLSEKVESEDAEEVIRLFRECLLKVAVDTETGKVDIDTLMTGTTKSQRDKIMILMDVVEELDKRNGGNGAPQEDILKMGEDQGLSSGFIREYLAKFKHDGDIYEPRPGFLKLLREY